MSAQTGSNTISLMSFLNLDTRLQRKITLCLALGAAASLEADIANYNTLVLFLIPILIVPPTAGWNPIVRVLPIERRRLGRHIWVMRVLLAPFGGSCAAASVLLYENLRLTEPHAGIALVWVGLLLPAVGFVAWEFTARVLPFRSRLLAQVAAWGLFVSVPAQIGRWNAIDILIVAFGVGGVGVAWRVCAKVVVPRAPWYASLLRGIPNAVDIPAPRSSRFGMLERMRNVRALATMPDLFPLLVPAAIVSLVFWPLLARLAAPLCDKYGLAAAYVVCAAVPLHVFYGHSTDVYVMLPMSRLSRVWIPLRNHLVFTAVMLVGSAPLFCGSPADVLFMASMIAGYGFAAKATFLLGLIACTEPWDVARMWLHDKIYGDADVNGRYARIYTVSLLISLVFTCAAYTAVYFGLFMLGAYVAKAGGTPLAILGLTSPIAMALASWIMYCKDRDFMELHTIERE